MGEINDNKLSPEEISLIERFKENMKMELRKNQHKGSILDFKEFDSIITQMEYHKSKLFLAIRDKNKGAIKEYLADVANFLLALGNIFEVYDEKDTEDECFEINKEYDLFKKIKVSNSSTNQKLI